MNRAPLLCLSLSALALFILAGGTVRAAEGATSPAAGYVAPPPLVAWTFGAPNDLAGWSADGADFTELAQSGKALTGRAVGPNAALLSPPVTFAPTAHQAVEIRLRVDRDTLLTVSGVGDAAPDAKPAEAPPPAAPAKADAKPPKAPPPADAKSAEGKPPVKADEKPTVKADEKPPAKADEKAAEEAPLNSVSVGRGRRMRTFRLLPFWQGAPLRRIRFAFSKPARVEVESVQVIDLARQPEPGTERPLSDEPRFPGAKEETPEPPSPLPGPTWRFERSAEGWIAASALDDLRWSLGTLRVKPASRLDALILSPPLALRADALPWLTLRLMANVDPDEEKRVTVFWARADRPGVQSQSVTLKAGNGFRVYPVPLGDNKAWSGPLAAVGLRLPSGLTVEVDYLHLGPQPDEAEPDTPPPSAL